MACTLADLVELAATIDPPPCVPERGYVSKRLWPTPHSVLFDIDGTEAVDASTRSIRLRDGPAQVRLRMFADALDL